MFSAIKNYLKDITWRPTVAEFTKLSATVVALILTSLILTVFILLGYTSIAVLIINCVYCYLYGIAYALTGILISMMCVLFLWLVIRRITKNLSPERLFKNG